MGLAKRLNEFFKQKSIDKQEFVEDYENIKKLVKQEFGDFEVKVSEKLRYSGGDPQVYSVFYFKDSDSYVMITAYHNSWDGDDYSYSKFVNCKPVQVIEYQFVKED